MSGDVPAGASMPYRAGDLLDPDHLPGTGTVLDEELAAERARQLIREHARQDVGAAPGRGRNNDAHRARRIIRLCRRRMGDQQKPSQGRRDRAKHAPSPRFKPCDSRA